MEGKIHAVYGGPGGSNTNGKENMNRKKKKEKKTCTVLLSTEENKNWETVSRANWHNTRVSGSNTPSVLMLWRPDVALNLWATTVGSEKTLPLLHKSAVYDMECFAKILKCKCV